MPPVQQLLEGGDPCRLALGALGAFDQASQLGQLLYRFRAVHLGQLADISRSLVRSAWFAASTVFAWL
jgi:hypothetical protein